MPEVHSDKISMEGSWTQALPGQMWRLILNCPALYQMCPLPLKKWRPDRLTDERIGWGGGDGEELVR